MFAVQEPVSINYVYKGAQVGPLQKFQNNVIFTTEYLQYMKIKTLS